MKNKKIVFLLALLVAISMVVNSCKKDSQGSIKTLFTSGTWQLASVMVYHYVGGSQIGNTDTLNTNCDTTQLFTFPSTSTCTYTNYDCVSQTKASGTWTLSKDQLFLQSGISVKGDITGSDTATTQPFTNARIVNLGQYSMVLQTGDVATYYTATTKRTIVQYGFVRQTITGN